MSKIVYEMDDDYNQAAAFLVEKISERDVFADNLKLLPPEARPEALRLLAELDTAIDHSEQALANQYEAYQNTRRLEEERDTIFDELTKSMAGAYVHAKYRNPEMISQLDSVIDGMDAEQAATFRDCIAQTEAGDLIRIIARQGETREQTEEFLRNYRAAKESE